MSGREDSRRQQTAGRAPIFGDSSGAVVHVRAGSLEELLRADAYSARRERDLLATKVALLAYKLQMNSQERRHHHHHHCQVCQASLCGRLVRPLGRSWESSPHREIAFVPLTLTLTRFHDVVNFPGVPASCPLCGCVADISMLTRVRMNSFMKPHSDSSG